MIQVTPSISIPEDEIQEEFIRASGPGGQNVNKVSSAVQLRFDVARSPSLPEEVRVRLMRLAAKQISREGVLLFKAQKFRTREANRRDAVQRLVGLIQRAAVRPKVRRSTVPTYASKLRRLAAKSHRGAVKAGRRIVPGADE